MDFNSYKTTFTKLKPGADIVQRWDERMVATGWAALGREGAARYLAQYGRGLGAKKAAALARVADLHGHPEVAERFYEESYFLETGLRVTGLGTTAAMNRGPVVSLPVSFGRSPQLLTVLPEDEADDFLHDPAWGLQEKIDGERLMVRVSGGAACGGSKRGLVRSLPREVEVALSFNGDALYDGELVGTVFHAFDLLGFGGQCFIERPFEERFRRLETVIANLLPAAQGCVRIVPLRTTTEEKSKARADLVEGGAEGFVLKRLRAPYTSGERHGDQFKFQFRSTSAFVVGEATDGRRSVQLFAHRSDGSPRDFGKVSIPANQSIPLRGTVVEVEYLYCHPGEDGKLAQPVLKGIRTDSEPDDCRADKVKIAVS